MQPLGNAFLACAGFAKDQHTVLTVGKGVDIMQQALHAVRNGDDVIRTLDLPLRALQAAQNAHQHGAQFCTGKVKWKHMRVLGGVAAGTCVAQAGADP
ncbi:hypothetical protein D3C72_1896750 [compost metagenome]